MVAPSDFDPADRRLPERLWRWAVQRLSMGREHTTLVSQQRKITQVNMAALLAMLATGVASLAFWATGNAALVWNAWINLPLLFLYPLVWRLNRRGRCLSASWLLVLLAMAGVLTGLFFAQGTVLFVHYYLLVFALMAPLLFPASHWRSGAFLFLLNVALFAYADLRGVAALPAIAQIDVASQALVRQGVVGSCLVLLVVLLRISEYSAAHSEWQLQQLASSDLLTGLPNRLAMRDAFTRELARRQREFSPMSFAIADIDFFKHVNDEWGHEAGDRALCHVSSILRAQIRAGELVARIGGEEFGVILLTDPEKATLAARRMCRAVEAAPFQYGGKTRTITISIGLVHLRMADDEQSALRRADAALYVAKHRGRNQVVVADTVAQSPG
jgi:diguanylate cyclase (GGDEF)-like protein